MTGSFTAPDELQGLVVKGLHEWELSQVGGPANPLEMVERARRLIPGDRQAGMGQLAIAIAPGPRQNLIAATRFDSESFVEELHEALVREAKPLFSRFERTEISRSDGVLYLQQEAAALHLDETGAICLIERAAYREAGERLGIEGIVEEDLQARIERSIDVEGGLLGQLDPTHRCTSVAVCAGLIGAGWMPWRSLAEHRANPGSATLGRGNDRIVVEPSSATHKRAALLHRRAEIAQELTVRLRREMKPL